MEITTAMYDEMVNRSRFESSLNASTPENERALVYASTRVLCQRDTKGGQEQTGDTEHVAWTMAPARGPVSRTRKHGCCDVSRLRFAHLPLVPDEFWESHRNQISLGWCLDPPAILLRYS